MKPSPGIRRRELIKSLAGSAAAFGFGSCAQAPSTPGAVVPNFLKDYADLYRDNPRAATLKWFMEAKFGLFLHYGVYSQLKRGEWVQLREKIPVAEYGILRDTFDPKNFDAGFITDLALSAGMKYVNLTSRHHDSFCLFRTNQTDFTSLDAPARRDLVAELCDACNRKGLGLFLYYSYALDWRHPYFYPRNAGTLGFLNARPDYPAPQPEYRFEKDEDFTNYLRFVHAQIKEILYRYKPLAGIWLDPIMGYYARPDLFPIETTYSLIREANPGALICFKQGANGGEDFVAPERTPRAHPSGGELAQQVWEKNKGKPIEICDTLQPRVWGYDERNRGEHRTADDVMGMLDHAAKFNANLLLNTGPLPDGSIPPEDVATLQAVGEKLAR